MNVRRALGAVGLLVVAGCGEPGVNGDAARSRATTARHSASVAGRTKLASNADSRSEARGASIEHDPIGDARSPSELTLQNFLSTRIGTGPLTEQALSEYHSRAFASYMESTIALKPSHPDDRTSVAGAGSPNTSAQADVYEQLRRAGEQAAASYAGVEDAQAALDAYHGEMSRTYVASVRGAAAP